MEEDLEEMTDAELDAEEKRLLDEIIRHDQTLTTEQRREHRRGLSLSRFKDNLSRILKLIEWNAPDPIIADAVTNLYSRAWSLWERDMGLSLASRMQHISRERSDRCVSCGVDLSYPLDRSSGLCAGCISEADPDTEKPA